VRKLYFFNGKIFSDHTALKIKDYSFIHGTSDRNNNVTGRYLYISGARNIDHYAIVMSVRYILISIIIVIRWFIDRRPLIILILIYFAIVKRAVSIPLSYKLLIKFESQFRFNSDIYYL